MYKVTLYNRLHIYKYMSISVTKETQKQSKKSSNNNKNGCNYNESLGSIVIRMK